MRYDIRLLPDPSLLCANQIFEIVEDRHFPQLLSYAQELLERSRESLTALATQDGELDEGQLIDLATKFVTSHAAEIVDWELGSSLRGFAERHEDMVTNHAEDIAEDWVHPGQNWYLKLRQERKLASTPDQKIWFRRCEAAYNCY